MNYVVEVEASRHDDVKVGVLAAPRGLTGSRYRLEPLNERPIMRPTLLNGPTYTTVVVSADEVRTDHEAIIVACQMVACTSDGMPTAARLISWPEDRSGW